MHFNRSGKLAPRYIGPYPITERISHIAYRVAISVSFSGIHDVFHVSQLRKCLKNPESVIETKQIEEVEICPNLTILQTLVVLLLLRLNVFVAKMFRLLRFNGQLILRTTHGKSENISSRPT